MILKLKLMRLLTDFCKPIAGILTGLTMISLSLNSYSQNNYRAFEIPVDDFFDLILAEDLNGDGAKDLVVPRYDESIGRELHVYQQLGDGSFAATPQRIEIKTEIIGFGFADLREDAGSELLLLANNGIFSLSSAMDGYAGNIKQLLEWDLIASVPQLSRASYIENISDITGDGIVDLLIPGVSGYGYFRGLGNEEFEPVLEFSTLNPSLTEAERETDDSIDANMRFSAERGLEFQISAAPPSPFANFVEQWDEDATDNETLLTARNWMPSVKMAQMNSDALLDLVYINVDDKLRGQLNVHQQQANGSFSEQPDWQQTVDTNGEIQLQDLNGDGVDDLIRTDGDGNDWNVYLYINADGSFNFGQPSQILRFSGYDLNINFIDIDLDGEVELSASYYTIPVVEAIRNASILRTQLLYRHADPGSEQLFNRRPDSSFEESFSADNVRGLAEQMSLQFDVDGDGNNDALYISEDGTLAARKIDDDLNIANQPFWQYVSDRTVFGFDVRHLNSDRKPDLILRHGTAVTVLVASP